jgi:hypothetical protein
VTSAQTERIAALEKAGNVATGRETRDDPAIAALTANVTALLASQNNSQGRGSGSSATIAYIFAGLGALATIIAIGFALIKP